MSSLYKAYDLGFCVSTFVESNILIHEIAPKTHVELDMIKEMIQVSTMLCNSIGQPHGSVTILPKGVTISKEAREFGSTDEANANVFGSAVVMNSLPHRILGNFFMNVQKPKKPFRLFLTKEEAIAWLLEIKKKGNVLDTTTILD